MSPAVLALNAGSSSLKFSTYRHKPGAGSLHLICRGEIAGIGGKPRLTAGNAAGEILVDRFLARSASQESALAVVREWIDAQFPGHNIVAAGHRVVHGGDIYAGPVRVDPSVLRTLERFVPLAPSHQPHNLAAIKALEKSHPDLLQVACFDTAFHQTQPAVARTYALPRALNDSGIKRYGFHGLSYEYIASVLPRFLGEAAASRVVVAHLGHGASMCALARGRSIATTMGFTALDGLPMGRRCGALDPGVAPFLVRERGMSIDEVEDLLYHESGLFGVSGLSDDMRDLLASDKPEAAEAVDLFCYRIGRELGSLAAALGGLDALVFTGGIGEHAPPVRARVCRHAGWLGIRLDDDANARGGPRLTVASGVPSAFVIATDEDLMIARHTMRIVHGAPSPEPRRPREAAD